MAGSGTVALKLSLKEYKPLKWMGILLLLILAAYIIGSILSSPIINAKKYQQLLALENRNFTDDIKEVDYRTIPLLDKDSAALWATVRWAAW